MEQEIEKIMEKYSFFSKLELYDKYVLDFIGK